VNGGGRVHFDRVADGAITKAELSSAQSYVALIFFCLLSVATYVALEVYARVAARKASGIPGSYSDLDQLAQGPGHHCSVVGSGDLADREKGLPHLYLGSRGLVGEQWCE
jgi:hypothetical protein